MARKTFSQVLQDNQFNLRDEFERLYRLFYKTPNITYSLYSKCENNFSRFPYRDTCISLDDFNRTFNFDFDCDGISRIINIAFLISFCEYSFNLVEKILLNHGDCGPDYILQVKKVAEKAGYIGIVNNGITDFVPKKPEALVAAESVEDSNISFDILEYNHHSMKGNIEEKKKMLLSFATYFENKRKELKEFNQNFERNLFTMFNEFNIRHDNNGKNPLLENITDEKLEEYYDLTYELCLTAFSILGGMDSNKKAKELRTKLGK